MQGIVWAWWKDNVVFFVIIRDFFQLSDCRLAFRVGDFIEAVEQENKMSGFKCFFDVIIAEIEFVVAEFLFISPKRSSSESLSSRSSTKTGTCGTDLFRMVSTNKCRIIIVLPLPPVAIMTENLFADIKSLIEVFLKTFLPLATESGTYKS